MGQKEDDGGDQGTVLEPADGPHRLNWGLAGIGITLLIVPLFMAVMFRDVYCETQIFLRIIASLGGGLIGSQIPGVIRVNFPGAEALGGMGVFALVLMWDPLWKVEAAVEKTEIAAENAAPASPVPTAQPTPTAQNTSLEQCISRKRQDYEKPRQKDVVGGARVGGPGLGGGRRQASERVCLSVGPEQQLISASTQQAVCHGGRCSVTEPVIEGGSVCVTAKAWSASNSFGGGGSGQYKLIASYKDVAGAQQLRDFEMVCRAEL